ncbi:AMP-binding protein [Saccharothrix sp. 6-C]|uniref:AMP-binding protein n=1 Tax=Saccharothrix sp. 6-C TaxID=2781735 RepID=UPI0019171879|nr:AMP-binding protein [Saccharothrix sp. 6-C]QQQ78732.1 AMP-binding protein [Saccharothrix sp. 6-C]
MTPALNRRPDDLAEQYRLRGWHRDETFFDDLWRQVRERPHKTAIVGRRLAESRSETLDFKELAGVADRFAGGLLELGVRRGDFVAVQLPNRWEMVALMFACMRVGAVICPIAPVCPPDELRHRLELTEARVLVTIPEWDGEQAAEIAVGLRAELPNLEHVLVAGRSAVDAADFHDHFVTVPWEAKHNFDGLALTADEPFVVLFTSGTTGESKGVLHSQNSLYGAVQGYVETFGLDEDLVACVSTPLVHYSGFVQGVLTGVHVGGKTVFQDVKDNAALTEIIEGHGATLLYGPPPTHADVVESQLADPKDVRTLRQAVVGSAPVLPQLVDALRDVMGARTYSLWGMSEFGPVTITRAKDPRDIAGYSHGRAIEGLEVRIDPTAVAGDGDIGKLWVRGAAQSLGYYKREDVFASGFDVDGWFDTGDLARGDGRGGIRIVGRAKDAIFKRGRVVPMVDIEALLEGHPQVLEAALVGLPGPDDDLVCAVLGVTDCDGLDLEAVRTYLRQSAVDEAFLPERVEHVAVIPRTLTGKIRKVVLRERYS